MPITSLHIALLAAFAASGFLAGLGGYPLLDNNEGLYARIALEMREGGDWIVPHLLGLPYLEKPPLLYWLTAGSFALFGKSETAARLPPAAASLAAVACTYALAARCGRPLAGWIAGLVVSTGIMTIVIGRTLYFDMLYTALLSLALSCAYFAVERRREGPMRAAAAFLALAVLAKGFVAVGLCAIVLAAFLVSTRAPLADWRRFFDPVAVAIFVAIVAPWHVAAALRDDQFAWFYFVNEHVGRLLGTREPKDYYSGPVWYYLPRLLGYAAPWTLLLPLAFLRRAHAHEPSDRFGAFLWSWLLGTLAVFSFAGNKANYYMIVGIVPLALILARPIAGALERGSMRVVSAVATALVVLLLGGLFAVGLRCTPELGERYALCDANRPLAFLPEAIAFAAGAAALWRMPDRRWRLLAPVLAIAFLAVPLRAAGVRVQALLDDRISQRAFVERVGARDDCRPIYVLGKLSDLSSFAFYFPRPFAMVENIDPEFHFPRQRPEAADRFLTMQMFRQVSDARPVYVVAENWRVGPLPEIPHTPELCVVLRTRRTALLSNVAADCPSS